MILSVAHGYPDCFPPNIEELIVADGAGENRFRYYRVSRSGKIDRDAFLSSYEERIIRDQNIHDRDVEKMDQITQKDIGLYSTSGFESRSRANNVLNLLRRHSDGPVLIVGETEPICGLSMKTKDSKSGRKSKRSHIDWWIYKDAQPELFFTYCEVSK